MPRPVDHGMRTCALIRNNFYSAHSANTCVCISMALNRTSSAIYAVLPLMARYIRLLEEGRAVHKMRRQVHVIRRRRARQREVILMVLLMGLALTSPPHSIWTRER